MTEKDRHEASALPDSQNGCRCRHDWVYGFCRSHGEKKWMDGTCACPKPAALRRSRTDHVDFDEGVAVETSAGRMDLLTCTSCGAAVLADPGTWRHKAWHEATHA